MSRPCRRAKPGLDPGQSTPANGLSACAATAEAHAARAPRPGVAPGAIAADTLAASDAPGRRADLHVCGLATLAVVVDHQGQEKQQYDVSHVCVPFFGTSAL